MKGIVVSVFLCMLMLVPLGQPMQELEIQNSKETMGRATGVDLTVSGISIFYPDSTNSTKYRMFSSNYPIAGFNRPQSLFAIDAVVNVESQIDISIENLGTASSGVVTVSVKILHNEYSYFEIASASTQISQISGGSQSTASVKLTPTYSGNHTLAITVTPTIADDDLTNNDYSRFFTVAYRYFNCDTLTGWTVGSTWNLNSDTSISMGTACHIGNGEASTYPNNLQSALVFPAMDMSDAHPSPLRTNGISFYYTGSLAPNDTIKMQALTALGAWNDLGTLQGTVDGTFLDGANWLTFSLADKGAASPIVPVNSQYFHQNSQFRFLFESDLSGNDIGFWFDEIIVLYDQKVRQSEYGVSAQGKSSVPSLPDEWGSIRIEVTNTGNISETFIPEVLNLPQDWEVYYARITGTSFDPLDGVTVTPGQPHQFDVRFKPGPNTSIGFHPMQLKLHSELYPSIATNVNLQYQVLADRIPMIYPPSPKPSCPPTYSCSFEVSVENIGAATDVFDLNLDITQLPSNWNVQFDWSQSTSVLLRPNQPTNIGFILSIPSDALPDTMSEFEFTLTAQNDTRRTITSSVGVSASMLSDASVDVSPSFASGVHYVDPGDSFTLSFTIWNNASRQDIFDMSVETDDAGQWVVHQPTRTNAVLNSGTSTTFDIVIDVPENAQGGDRGPTITPIIQSQRSFMEIRGQDFDRMRVNTFYDVEIEQVSIPQKLTPGQANEILLKLTNHGNGQSETNLSFPNLPDSWQWWVVDEHGNIIQDNIDLSAPYDLEDILTISVWMFLPNKEGAGEFHTIEVFAQTMNGQDINTQNNALEFTIITSSIRIPMLTLGNQTIEVESGGSGYAESILTNLGNAVDDRLSVRASISVHPPNAGIVAFFTVNGGDRQINQDVQLQLLPSQEIVLRTELLLPDDLALNSRIVISYEIIGAIDENGLPYTMETEAMMMVTKKRTLTFETSQFNTDQIEYNLASPFYVNITSTSSEPEIIFVAVEHPEEWQILCQKVLYDATPLQFSLQPGMSIEQRQTVECEARRFGGVLEGNIVVQVYTEDSTISQTFSISMVFEKEPVHDGMSTQQIALFGGGGLLLLLSLLFILRRRSVYEEVEEEVSQIQQSGPPIQEVQKLIPVLGHTAGHNEQSLDHNTLSPSQHIQHEATVGHENSIVPAEQVAIAGPPLPEGGLPAGWTMEQWQYYGQQYLDGTL
jgi:uncharacterized membrane protein